jgi:hypothetical protein
MTSSLVLWLALVGIGVVVSVLIADERDARRARKEKRK